MPSGRSHAGTPGGGPCKEMGNEPLRNLRFLRFPILFCPLGAPQRRGEWNPAPTGIFFFYAYAARLSFLRFPISDLRFK